VRRVALITGFGRARGIAAAVARRLTVDHDLMLTGLPSYDARHEPGGEPPDTAALAADLGGSSARVHHLAADLAEAAAPARLVASAHDELGGLDTLVAAHAHAVPLSLGALEAEAIDRHLTVNVRATLLLVKAFAATHDPDRGQGRIVLFNSGQGLGPMPAELPYVASKGALQALVLSLADVLAPANVTINAINPGPTDTGLLDGETYEAIRRRFPAGRWGTPDDAARAVAWLASEEAAWITGQLISSEGGFRRSG
jgi:3-oxoacyl-[acyl-carrier protein] reductase